MNRFELVKELGKYLAELTTNTNPKIQELIRDKIKAIKSEIDALPKEPKLSFLAPENLPDEGFVLQGDGYIDTADGYIDSYSKLNNSFSTKEEAERESKFRLIEASMDRDFSKIEFYDSDKYIYLEYTTYQGKKSKFCFNNIQDRNNFLSKYPENCINRDL